MFWKKAKWWKPEPIEVLRDEKGLYYAMWRQQIGERKNSQDISEPVMSTTG